MSVEALGSAYNPSRTTITLTALQELKSVSEEVLAAVNSKLGVYNKAIADRESLFAPFSKLITRVINALRASEASPAMVSSAESIVRKLQGRRATPKKTTEELAASAADGTVTKQISSSKMSFDNRIENFDRFIQLLATIPEYAPNETELQTVTLTTYLQSLQAANAAAIDAETKLDNARIARNQVLYQPSAGLVDVAAAVKLYVKSVFGATSAQYKQVSGLVFKTMVCNNLCRTSMQKP